MLKYALALGLAGVAGLSMAVPQEPRCLHGQSEAPADALRRQAALRLTRELNTAEAAFHQQRQRYAEISQLQNVSSEPDGFHAQLSTDGATYILSVKDTLDACRFAFFSDQQGLIYTAQPIR
jgi:hypothetical protein